MLTCHYVLGVSKVTPVLKIWKCAGDLILCTKVKELAVVENIHRSSQALHVLRVAVFILRNMSVFLEGNRTVQSKEFSPPPPSLIR